MGIFSLFGKKNSRQNNSADKDASRSKRGTSTSRQRADSNSGGANSSRLPAAKRDAQAALATVLKIDAIESEMSSEFKVTTIQPVSTPSAAKASAPATPPASAKPSAPQAAQPRSQPTKATGKAPEPARAAAPEMGAATDFLLNGSSTIGTIGVATSEVTAVVEEAAIMYANGQVEVVEQLLQNAIAEDLMGDSVTDVWLMLFDLYQVTGNQQQFENLSIAYASKFETSPPGWQGNVRKEQKASMPSGAAPTVPFSGKLNAGSAKTVERILKLTETHRALRLEFVRVSGVDVAGCGLLLNLLKKLQKSGHDLILVGAAELAEKIRATTQVGRRDDSEDAWLLLLEILQLLNREKEFEETSIDYCVTFEVSPPAFVAPQTKVTTATAEAQPETAAGDTAIGSFVMPAVVEGKIDNLILAIVAYSDEHSPAIVDCSGLTRVDFNAAGRLLTGLAPFCGNGRTIEFHNVNHLVAALFNVIGLNDIARILPRKN
ncbi:MAG TPA: STAS domain-containing protein [Noviherbaspirillum sp.]|nr:STAS domain-containing protein [Noviherbaspirillum sp.]